MAQVKPQDTHLDFAYVAELQRAIVGAQTAAELTTGNKPGSLAYNSTNNFFHARGATTTRNIPWEDATPASEFILNAAATAAPDRKGLVVTANGIYAKNGNDELVPFLAGNMVAAGSLQTVDPTGGHKVAYRASTATSGVTDYTVEAANALPAVKSVRMISPTGKETFETLETFPIFANDAARVAAGYVGVWRTAAGDVFKSDATTAGALRHLTTNDLANVMNWRGTLDASAGRPDANGVTDIGAGDVWIVTTAGTIAGIEGADALEVGDFLIAMADNPTAANQYAGIQTNTSLDLNNVLVFENQTVNLAAAPVTATFTVLTNVRSADCYDSTGLKRDTLNIRLASATTVEVDGVVSISNLRVIGFGSV